VGDRRPQGDSLEGESSHHGPPPRTGQRTRRLALPTSRTSAPR
jgi:hypothetical protein